MTTFLVFPDAAAFLATMPADFERRGETGGPLPEGVEAISILGQDPRRGGRWDAHGKEIEAPEVLPGFHVNFLGDVPEAWALYVIEAPAHPLRSF